MQLRKAIHDKEHEFLVKSSAGELNDISWQIPVGTPRWFGTQKYEGKNFDNLSVKNISQ